eukprot:8793107-Alexandrium_andersonii.AAC.1
MVNLRRDPVHVGRRARRERRLQVRPGGEGEVEAGWRPELGHAPEVVGDHEVALPAQRVLTLELSLIHI